MLSAHTLSAGASIQGSYCRHTNPVSEGGSSGCGHLVVFGSDFTFTVSLSQRCIVHKPAQELNINRLVLCRNYVAGSPFSCAAGADCKFVHADADIAALERRPVHVNYAWRSLSCVSYPRLPPGETLTVAVPSNTSRKKAKACPHGQVDANLPQVTLPSESVLVTRGSAVRFSPGRPLLHCAHYYYTRECNRGEQCNFIHAVHVDPTVQEGEFRRAPPGPRPSVVRRTQRPAARSTQLDEMQATAHPMPDFAYHSDEATPTNGSDLHSLSLAVSPDEHPLVGNLPMPLFALRSQVGSNSALPEGGHQLPPHASAEMSATTATNSAAAVMGNRRVSNMSVSNTSVVSMATVSANSVTSMPGATARRRLRNVRVIALEEVDPVAAHADSAAAAVSSTLSRPRTSSGLCLVQTAVYRDISSASSSSGNTPTKDDDIAALPTWRGGLV